MSAKSMPSGWRGGVKARLSRNLFAGTSHELGVTTLVVDKCKNKQEIEDFNQYLVNQLEAKLPLNIPLRISHEDSKTNTGLQAVDAFCWGIYRKYEHGDIEWYQHFADKIAFETEYLGDEQA